jgi:hypothetical protein
MPFWDDLDLAALHETRDRLLLFDVLDRPRRFRFSLAGTEVGKAYADTLAGRFADDIEVRPPLDFIASQSSATGEGRAPTYYAHAQDAQARRPPSGKTPAYARLLLPLWGEGGVRMLLGVVAFGAAASQADGRGEAP